VNPAVFPKYIETNLRKARCYFIMWAKFVLNFEGRVIGLFYIDAAGINYSDPPINAIVLNDDLRDADLFEIRHLG
jgi:hypothetical protein